MKEDEGKEGNYEGAGLKGPLYWLAAAATAQAVKGPGGLLGGLLGGVPPDGPGAPVTQKILELTTENQGLKSQLYANTLNAQQAVWNASQQARIDYLEKQVAALYGMTQLSIPNGNLNPGYGQAVVTPVIAEVKSAAGGQAANNP